VSETFQRILKLIEQDDHLVSEHAIKSLSDDNIGFVDVLTVLKQRLVVEDYPDYHKGPAVLILNTLESNVLLHTLWGIPAGADRPATLITAYVPDPQKWQPDFLTRRKK
jgi:hypothetical protein